MEKQQENQAEQTPQTEEEKQPETTEKSPPTIEELEALRQELEKAKNQANTYQGLLKDTQRKSITRDDLQAIFDRIDGQQRWTATALDDIRKATSGDYEEPQQPRKTYLADAEEHINKATEGRTPPKDPMAEKFFEYLEEEGLDFESDFVRDVIQGTKTPQEALKALKGKVKERDREKLREELKGEITDQQRQMREQILKEYGLTTTGANGPSAPNVDLSSMTPDQKLQEGFKKYKKK